MTAPSIHHINLFDSLFGGGMWSFGTMLWRATMRHLVIPGRHFARLCISSLVHEQFMMASCSQSVAAIPDPLGIWTPHLNDAINSNGLEMTSLFHFFPPLSCFCFYSAALSRWGGGRDGLWIPVTAKCLWSWSSNVGDRPINGLSKKKFNNLAFIFYGFLSFCLFMEDYIRNCLWDYWDLFNLQI